MAHESYVVKLRLAVIAHIGVNKLRAVLIHVAAAGKMPIVPLNSSLETEPHVNSD